MYPVIPLKGTVYGLTYDLNDPWNGSNDIHLEAKGGEDCLVLPEIDADIDELRVLTFLLGQFHSILQDRDCRTKIAAGFYSLETCPRCGGAAEFRIGREYDFGLPHDTYRIVCSRCNLNGKPGDDIENSSPEGAIIGWRYRISRVSP